MGVVAISLRSILKGTDYCSVTLLLSPFPLSRFLSLYISLCSSRSLAACCLHAKAINWFMMSAAFLSAKSYATERWGSLWQVAAKMFPYFLFAFNNCARAWHSPARHTQMQCCCCCCHCCWKCQVGLQSLHFRFLVLIPHALCGLFVSLLAIAAVMAIIFY